MHERTGSVLLEFQGQGIGSKLIKTGLSRIKNGIGGCGCVLVGPPNFYSMFSFANYPLLIQQHIGQLNEEKHRPKHGSENDTDEIGQPADP